MRRQSRHTHTKRRRESGSMGHCAIKDASWRLMMMNIAVVSYPTVYPYRCRKQNQNMCASRIKMCVRHVAATIQHASNISNSTAVSKRIWRGAVYYYYYFYYYEMRLELRCATWNKCRPAAVETAAFFVPHKVGPLLWLTVYSRGIFKNYCDWCALINSYHQGDDERMAPFIASSDGLLFTRINIWSIRLRSIK